MREREATAGDPVVGHVEMLHAEPVADPLAAALLFARSLPPGFAASVLVAESSLLLVQVVNELPGVLGVQRWQQAVAAAARLLAPEGRPQPYVEIDVPQVLEPGDPRPSAVKSTSTLPLSSLSFRMDLGSSGFGNGHARAFFSAALRKPTVPSYELSARAFSVTLPRGSTSTTSPRGSTATLAYNGGGDFWTLASAGSSRADLDRMLCRGGSALGARWRPAAMVLSAIAPAQVDARGTVTPSRSGQGTQQIRRSI